MSVTLILSIFAVCLSVFAVLFSWYAVLAIKRLSAAVAKLHELTDADLKNCVGDDDSLLELFSGFVNLLRRLF